MVAIISNTGFCFIDNDQLVVVNILREISNNKWFISHKYDSTCDNCWTICFDAISHLVCHIHSIHFTAGYILILDSGGDVYMRGQRQGINVENWTKIHFVKPIAKITDGYLFNNIILDTDGDLWIWRNISCLNNRYEFCGELVYFKDKIQIIDFSHEQDIALSIDGRVFNFNWVRNKFMGQQLSQHTNLPVITSMCALTDFISYIDIDGRVHIRHKYRQIYSLAVQIENHPITHQLLYYDKFYFVADNKLYYECVYDQKKSQIYLPNEDINIVALMPFNKCTIAVANSNGDVYLVSLRENNYCKIDIIYTNHDFSTNSKLVKSANKYR